MEPDMKRLLAVTGICTLLAAPAFAQTDTKEEAPPAPSKAEVEAAVKTINDMAADQKKVSGYCAISKEMGDLKDGEDKKAEELNKKMDDYLTSLGEPVSNAFGMAESVDPASEEGQKLDAAFTALDEKCGS
jgi:hypothetical protein